MTYFEERQQLTKAIDEFKKAFWAEVTPYFTPFLDWLNKMIFKSK